MLDLTRAQFERLLLLIKTQSAGLQTKKEMFPTCVKPQVAQDGAGSRAEDDAEMKRPRSPCLILLFL